MCAMLLLGSAPHNVPFVAVSSAKVSVTERFLSFSCSCCRSTSSTQSASHRGCPALFILKYIASVTKPTPGTDLYLSFPPGSLNLDNEVLVPPFVRADVRHYKALSDDCRCAIRKIISAILVNSGAGVPRHVTMRRKARLLSHLMRI